MPVVRLVPQLNRWCGASAELLPVSLLDKNFQAVQYPHRESIISLCAHVTQSDKISHRVYELAPLYVSNISWTYVNALPLHWKLHVGLVRLNTSPPPSHQLPTGACSRTDCVLMQIRLYLLLSHYSVMWGRRGRGDFNLRPPVGICSRFHLQLWGSESSRHGKFWIRREIYACMYIERFFDGGRGWLNKLLGASVTRKSYPAWLFIAWYPLHILYCDGYMCLPESFQ